MDCCILLKIIAIFALGFGARYVYIIETATKRMKKNLKKGHKVYYYIDEDKMTVEVIALLDNRTRVMIDVLDTSMNVSINDIYPILTYKYK